MTRDDRERAQRLAAGRPIDLAVVQEALRLYAVGRQEIEAIWAFGSQARRSARAGSDLDLALDLRPQPGLLDEWSFRADAADEIQSVTGVPVDVVILSERLPLPLLWEILRQPTLLYERESGRGAAYGGYLRSLCRDQWPRLERRWERTREWVRSLNSDATPGRP